MLYEVVLKLQTAKKLTPQFAESVMLINDNIKSVFSYSLFVLDFCNLSVFANLKYDCLLDFIVTVFDFVFEYVENFISSCSLYVNVFYFCISIVGFDVVLNGFRSIFEVNLIRFINEFSILIEDNIDFDEFILSVDCLLYTSDAADD